jgi:hypothetical protein
MAALRRALDQMTVASPVPTPRGAFPTRTEVGTSIALQMFAGETGKARKKLQGRSAAASEA